jgi:hypothetical protein
MRGSELPGRLQPAAHHSGQLNVVYAAQTSGVLGAEGSPTGKCNPQLCLIGHLTPRLRTAGGGDYLDRRDNHSVNDCSVAGSSWWILSKNIGSSESIASCGGLRPVQPHRVVDQQFALQLR